MPSRWAGAGSADERKRRSGRDVDQVSTQRGPAGASVPDRGGDTGGASKVERDHVCASQAAFATYLPDGRCANGPSFISAMTCSTIAWSRCRASASIVVRSELVTKRVMTVGGNNSPCPVASVENPDEPVTELTQRGMIADPGRMPCCGTHSPGHEVPIRK